MSMFHRQGIPEDIVRNRIEIKECSQNQRSKDMRNKSRLVDGFQDLLMLPNYLFVYIIDQSTFEMHRLVQLGTRTWLEADGQLEKWRRRFVQSLCVSFQPANTRIGQSAKYI